MRALRTVYPGAVIEREGDHATLAYEYAGQLAPVFTLTRDDKGELPKGDRLAWVMLCACSRRLGFNAVYTPRFPSGKIGFTAIADFKGPEAELPVEYDPNTPQDQVDALVAAAVKAKEENAVKGEKENE